MWRLLKKKKKLCVRKMSCWGLTKISATKKTCHTCLDIRRRSFWEKTSFGTEPTDSGTGFIPGSSGDRWVEGMGLSLGGQILGFCWFRRPRPKCEVYLGSTVPDPAASSPKMSFFLFSKGNSPFGEPFFSNQNPW